MAKITEKGGTLAKDYICGQTRKLGEVAKVTIIPWPDKISTIINGQKVSGGPWPHVSIPFNTLHGALSQKPTISGGSSLRETRQTKVSANLGRKGDRGTLLGAKILNENFRMKGAKLSKVREEFPRETLKYQQTGGCEIGGPVRGPSAAGLSSA